MRSTVMVSAQVVMRTGRKGAPNSEQRCQLKGVRQSQVLVSRTESVRVRETARHGLGGNIQGGKSIL